MAYKGGNYENVSNYMYYFNQINSIYKQKYYVKFDFVENGLDDKTNNRDAFREIYTVNQEIEKQNFRYSNKIKKEKIENLIEYLGIQILRSKNQ